jgi:hypothetical protein
MAAQQVALGLEDGILAAVLLIGVVNEQDPH